MKTPSLLGCIPGPQMKFFMTLSLFFFLTSVSCTNDATTCVTGEQISCACPEGKSGVRECKSGGTYGACSCFQKTDSDGGGSTDSDGGDPTTDMAFEKRSLMKRLVGLWVGPALQTPLGTFPIMNMDLRPVDDVLFSRVDLDSDNALRFGFYFETIGGRDHLVYRNGGLFMALERDTKTVLMSETINEYVFCEPLRGCDYLKATWTFANEDNVTLVVKVDGVTHLSWSAKRKESRTAPTPFPSSNDSLGTKVDFPAMPTLDVKVTTSEASVGDSYVWVILSDTACGLSGRDCEASRSIRIPVLDGQNAGISRIEQIHGGSYFINAIWDRNGNFETRPFPDSGDEIASPDGTTTVAVGSSVLITTSFALP